MPDRRKEITHVSAARTAAVTPSIQNGALITDNYFWKGVIATLEVTAASGTGGLKLIFRGYDWTQEHAIDTTGAPTVVGYALNDGGTLVTATGTYAYVIYPSALTAAGGVVDVAQMVLPGVFDVYISHGDGSSYTYSAGLEFID